MFSNPKIHLDKHRLELLKLFKAHAVLSKRLATLRRGDQGHLAERRRGGNTNSCSTAVWCRENGGQAPLVASLLLVAMPFAPSSALVTSRKARRTVRSVLVRPGAAGSWAGEDCKLRIGTTEKEEFRRGL